MLRNRNGRVTMSRSQNNTTSAPLTKEREVEMMLGSLARNYCTKCIYHVEKVLYHCTVVVAEERIRFKDERRLSE